MESKKISEIPILTPETLEALRKIGDFYLPAYTPKATSKNSRIDLGRALDLVCRSIRSQVEAVIQEKIDANEIGGGTSGGSSGSQEEGEEGESTEMQQLKTRLSNLESLINDPDNWPTNYIKLQSPSGSTSTLHGFPSGPGTSGYSDSNPLVITVSNVQLPNFNVILTPSVPTRSDNTTISQPVIVEIGARDLTTSQELLGSGSGSIGNIVIRGSLTTNLNKVYEFTTYYEQTHSQTLNASDVPSKLTINTTLAVTVPAAETVVSATITCTVQDKPISVPGTFLSPNTVRTGSGNIYLD